MRLPQVVGSPRVQTTSLIGHGQPGELAQRLPGTALFVDSLGLLERAVAVDVQERADRRVVRRDLIEKCRSPRRRPTTSRQPSSRATAKP